MLKIVKIIDLVMITIPFALCWELYYSYQVYAKFGWKGKWAMIGLFAVLFFLLGKVYDAFWISLQRISELIYGQVLAAMATDGILYIVICLMARRLCQSSAGYCGDCRTDHDGNPVGKMRPYLVFPDFSASAHRSGLRCPAWTGKAHQ